MRRSMARARGVQQACLALLVCVLTAETGNAACDSSDSQTLLEFKSSVDDPDSAFWNWVAGSDCCSWQGVTCDSSSWRVIGLRVAGFPVARGGHPISPSPNYNGIVGDQLGRLTALQSLSFVNTNFSAPIPESIGNLVNLEYLNFQLAGWTGSIPASIANLVKLETLLIFGNDFPAPVPVELCNLTSLKDVSITSYGFTGTLPICIGNSWKNVVSLDLSANKFSGHIPSNLGSLSQLTYLHLGSNLLSGPIPATLSKLSQLMSLDLSDNFLTGSIPTAFSKLTRLTIGVFSSNKLTGKLPVCFTKLVNLTCLDLSINYFSRVIPPRYGSFPSLYILVLNNNKLSGHIPPELGKLGNVDDAASIYLSSNFLSGNIPAALGNPYIYQLDVSNNYLVGGFPLGLAAITNIVLSNNKLTGAVGSLPTDASDIQLKYLALDSNKFSGPIPNWLLQLPLIQLNLANNSFTGELPLSLLSAPNLLSLNLSSNPLITSLPTSSFKAGLTELDLHSCRLYGPITPTFLRSLTNIFDLYMYDNFLSGPLPYDIGSALNHDLAFLDLHNNDLTGTVPTSIKNLTSLLLLNLLGNRFTGDVPHVP